MKQRFAVTGMVCLLSLGIGRSALAHGYPQDTMPAAHAAAEATEHFHGVIEHVTGFSHLAQDVHKLADAAKHFHMSIEKGADYDHALQDFNVLKRAYAHVRQAVRKAHNAHHNNHVMRDWYQVEYAFEELEWTM